MHYIYGLADEQDHVIRYVGQTKKFEKRIRDHRSEALKYNINPSVISNIRTGKRKA